MPRQMALVNFATMTQSWGGGGGDEISVKGILPQPINEINIITDLS